MELIKRYIHEVTRQLPEQQRAEIGKELEGLIGDMLEERLPDGSPATVKDVEAVLLELGDPQLLADRYRGSGRYLIGPELFAPYLSVLKIVCFAILIAITVEFAISSVIQPGGQPEFSRSGMLDQFVSYIVDLCMGVLQGFSSVTVIFGLIEYTGVRKSKIGGGSSKAWNPSELPPLPSAQNRIRRSEPIAGLIFTILFGVLLTLSIDWLGVWRFSDSGETTIVPVFDAAVFQGYLPFIWIFLATTIMRDALKIIVGRWTEPLVIINIVINFVQFGLAVLMLANPAVWNPDFMAQMAQAGISQAGDISFDTIQRTWDWARNGLVYLIGFIFIIELVVDANKLFKLKRAA